MDSPHPGTPLPNTVRLLVAARAVNRLGAFSLSFLTVLLCVRFGASPAAAGTVSAAFGLATIPSRLAGGRLADRIGRRYTIVLGLAGCAVAQLGIAAAWSLGAAAGFAVLLGLAFELYEPPSQAVIADAVGPADRVRAFGLLNAALAAGGAGAGLLAATLGRIDLRYLFVADALTCLACAAIVLPGLPPDHPRRAGGEPVRRQDQRDRRRRRTAAANPWRDPALLAVLAAGTLFALIYMQVLICLPLILPDRGLNPADAGLLATASALIITGGQPLLRRRPLRTLSMTPALTAGYLLLAAALAGYAAAHSLTAFLAATAVFSAGDLLLMGRMYALAADLAPAGATAGYLAAFGISWGIATVAAPLVGTRVLQAAGPSALCLAMAIGCAVLAVGNPLLLRTTRGRRPARKSSGPQIVQP